MVCKSCAESISRHLGTTLVGVLAGNCDACGLRGGRSVVTRKIDGASVKICQPCYDKNDLERYVHGQRYHACHKPDCTKSGILRSLTDGHRSCRICALDTHIYKHHSRPCRGDGCRKSALYASFFQTRPVACGTHKTDDEYVVVANRCRVCVATNLNWYEAPQVKKKHDLCPNCMDDSDRPIVRFYESTITRAVVDKLRSTAPAFTTTINLMLEMHSSDRAYRPDLVLRFAGKTVFIEVDEGEHRSYKCEVPREVSIFSSTVDIDSDKLMVRINPDAGGSKFTLFTKKATIKDIADGLDPLSFTTPRFNEKIDEIVLLVKAFVNGGVAPGHIHYINWTTLVPPRPLEPT